MRDADTWFRHMDISESSRYVWSDNPANSKSARESSILHRHKPVVSYDEDELDEPMHNGTVSIWEMCAGLLGQVYFTMPLKKNVHGQYVLSTLMSESSTAYNPYDASSTPNISALEDFILEISR